MLHLIIGVPRMGHFFLGGFAWKIFRQRPKKLC